MKKNEIMKIADKHCDLMAGWIFNYPSIMAFWDEAYKAGQAHEREECAKLCEQMVPSERNTGLVPDEALPWTQFCSELIRLRQKNEKAV